MNNTNKTRNTRYNTFNVYRTQNGGFYAIADGNLTRDPSFSNGEGKTSYIMSSMGCGDYPISNRARKAGLPIPETVDIQFANLRFFGKKAEALHEHAKKGDKLVVAGKIEYDKVEKNGRTYHNLSITVDEFFVNPFSDSSFASGGIARFTEVYTAGGTNVSHPMLANFAGLVLNVESREYEKRNGPGTGNLVRVSIKTDTNPEQAYDLATGAKKGEYNNEGGYMYITMFGRLADRATKCVRKGAHIAFTGEVKKTVNEDTGKVYYEMVANDYIILKWAPRTEDSSAETANEPARNNAPVAENKNMEQKPTKTPTAPEQEFYEDDEDDDELPF